MEELRLRKQGEDIEGGEREWKRGNLLNEAGETEGESERHDNSK